jgi:hypothetical protein
VFQERLFKAMGPTRIMKFSDGATRLDPTFQFLLRSGTKGSVGYLVFKILPAPYCRRTGHVTLSNPDETDTVRRLVVTAPNDAAPGIDATFKLSNGLNPLGYRVQVHPFFNDMWVNVNFTGTWGPEIIDAIATSIGGSVMVEKGPPNTYSILPDPEEIRSRALKTLEFYALRSTDTATLIREKLRYDLLRAASAELLKKWIDACQKRHRVQTSNESYMPSVKRYRDLVLDDVIKNNPKFLPYTLEECQSMPVYLDFQGYLDVGISLQTPKGVFIHL